MSASIATRPIPPAAKAELTPTGKLRAGINFQNQLLTTLGPNGEQGGVAVEFAHELARRLAVPLEIIPYKSAGALADSVSTGAWDISVLGDEPERAKVIAALESSTFSGHLMPYGPTKFVNGQNQGAAPVNTQVLGNDIQVIFPQTFATAKPVFPMPPA